jgi:hypothetical protein
MQRNSIAHLRCSTDKAGRFVWIVTNLQHRFSAKSVRGELLSKPVPTFSRLNDSGAGKESYRGGCQRLGQALALFPYLHPAAN